MPSIQLSRYSARTLPWLVAASIALLAIGGIAAGVLLSVKTPVGTIIVEVDQPELTGAEVSVDGQQKVTINPGNSQEPIEVVADGQSHTLQVTKGGFTTLTKEFTVKAGKDETIRVHLEPLSQPPLSPAIAETKPARAETSTSPPLPSSSVQDNDRSAAALVLASGASIEVQQGANVTAVSPGQTLPNGSFRIVGITAPKAANTDLEPLVGLRYLTRLNLSNSVIDEQAIRHLSQLRSLKFLNIANTKLKSEHLAALGTLPVLSSLSMGHAQQNDSWRFLKTLASLRVLTVQGTVARDVERLAAFPQLRWVHFHDVATVDEAIVQQIQKNNPNLRFLLGAGNKIRAVGHDPGKTAARRLISSGVVLVGRPYSAASSGKPLTLETVDSDLPVVVLEITIPANVNLSADERQLLTAFDGSYSAFSGRGIKNADAFAPLIAGNGSLWGVHLTDSDLTDSGLAHLQPLTGLLSLDVKNTKVSVPGVAAFERAVPICKVLTSTSAPDPKSPK